MARFDLRRRASKKRVSQARWERREIIHGVIFIVLTIAFCLLVGYWIATHPFD